MSEEKKTPEQEAAELNSQQLEGVAGGKAEATKTECFINATLCTCCGNCVFVCPKKCISRYGDTYVINKVFCNNCGNCVKVCPVQAVKLVEF